MAPVQNIHHDTDAFLGLQRDLGLGLSATASMEEAVRLLLDAAIGLGEIDAGIICLYNDQTGTFQCAGQKGAQDFSYIGKLLTDKRSPEMESLQKGHTVFFEEDRLKSTAVTGEKKPAKAAAIIPFRNLKTLIAVLAVTSVSVPEFSTSVRMTLEAIAAQAVGAIRRIQTEETEHAQRCLAEALVETGAALNSSLDLEVILDQILTIVTKVVPYDAASFMVIENDVARVIRSQGYVERGLAEIVSEVRFPINTTPNLKRIAKSQKPLAIADITQYRDWVPYDRLDWMRSFAAAPIIIQGEVVGFLNLDSAVAGFYNQSHADILQIFATQAAIAIQNARLYAEVQRLAITDELTGLLNWRGLLERGAEEIDRAERYTEPLSALLLDIDQFKQFNDKHGHLLGDEVLREMGRLLQENIRVVDHVGRYGGDEFIILLPKCPLDEAERVAKRLHTLLSEMPLSTSAGEMRVTVSVGVALLPKDSSNISQLIDCADKALYQAKHHGRNQVCVDKPARRLHGEK
ncbi:MAG TPA: diguanylate cyclase [Longilinea sp.]|nr:diguanylate cyclase [Longilinea sp.]